VRLRLDKSLPWLAENADTLGFGESASRKLIAGAKKAANQELATDLDEASALRISRDVWGHAPVRGTQGTGENEWHTPDDYLDLARAALPKAAQSKLISSSSSARLRPRPAAGSSPCTYSLSPAKAEAGPVNGALGLA
jgi:hypothetical protein